MCQDWFKFFQGFWNRPIFNSGMILQSSHICKCDPLASLLLPSLVGCPCSSAEEYSILYVLWNKCIFSNFQLSYLVEIRSHMFENILISFIQELCVTRMNAWNWHSSPVGEWIKWKKKFSTTATTTTIRMDNRSILSLKAHLSHRLKQPCKHKYYK